MSDINLFNQICLSSNWIEIKCTDGYFMIRPASKGYVAVDYVEDDGIEIDIIDGGWFRSNRHFRTWAKQFRS